VSKTLDAVAKSKQAYVLAKATMETRMRQQMNEELSNIRTQIDIAVRYAFDSGERKADILRALGTKDYNTVNESLARTGSVSKIVGIDPLDKVYTLTGDDTVVVLYDRHGPSYYSGEASFTYRKLDDGTYLFFSLDSLWSEDYKTRNDVVAVLDGQKDGFYYEELSAWLAGTG
jgi:plasmid replication initiation protein